MILEQGIYEHYKSTKDRPKLYQVLFLSHDEATLEILVHYCPLYYENDSTSKDGITLWTRSLKDFTAQVTISGKSIPRFKKISAS